MNKDLSKDGREKKIPFFSGRNLQQIWDQCWCLPWQRKGDSNWGSKVVRTLPITIGDPKIAIVITKKEEEKIMLILIRRANVEVYYPHSWLGNI